MLVDTERLDQCFPAVDYFEGRGIPFVVCVNCFDGVAKHQLEDVREALGSSLVASHDDVRLETVALGDESNLIGAAERAFAPLLEDPLGVLEETRANVATAR